jgi:hypothetical protein
LAPVNLHAAWANLIALKMSEGSPRIGDGVTGRSGFSAQVDFVIQICKALDALEK